MNKFTTMPLNEITSCTVKNPDGKDLGNIKDVVVDLPSGQVEYAVLSFGGFLGMGDKYFAVPWKALAPNHDDECMILNVTEERLKKSEGFDKDNWPNFADPSFRSRVAHQYA